MMEKPREVESKEEIFGLPYYLTQDGKKRYLNIIHDWWYFIYDEYGRELEEHFGNSYWLTYYNDVKHFKICIFFDQETSIKHRNVWKYEPWDYINPTIDIFDDEKFLEYCQEHPKYTPYLEE